jgi:hypothetical protein
MYKAIGVFLGIFKWPVHRSFASKTFDHTNACGTKKQKVPVATFNNTIFLVRRRLNGWLLPMRN